MATDWDVILSLETVIYHSGNDLGQRFGYKANVGEILGGSRDACETLILYRTS
jgi:hypothetical protein